jgi:ABC-type multidrug transport system ATPase subunit
MRLPRVHLADFRLRAYRSCKSTTFSPDSRITALIGSNGSGKTNVLQGLMLLGGSQRRYRREEEDVFKLESQVSATFVVNKKPVQFRASIVYRPTERNRDQILSSQEEWNFREITGKDEWQKLPPSEIMFYSRVGVLQHRRISYLNHADKGVTSELSKKTTALMDAIDDFRHRTVYYSASQFTNPALCPPSFEIDEDGDLYDQGASEGWSREHLQFIHQLYRMYKNQQPLYSTYLSLVDGRGVGLIEKLQWKETKYSTKAYEVTAGGKVITRKRSRLLIIPTVYIGDSHLSFAQLSEGTFRTLAILFYVITDSSRLLLIEEPEVCIHHGLLTSVVDIIREFAREKQIIFSTHSESILDKLEPDNVRLVTKGDSGTVVGTISKVMSARQYQALKKYLETEGSLGEYWRHSGFGQ